MTISISTKQNQVTIFIEKDGKTFQQKLTRLEAQNLATMLQLAAKSENFHFAMEKQVKSRLPGLLELAVEYHGRHYPAWLERGSRRVWCLAGSVGFGAQILITHDWRVRDRNHAKTLMRRLRKTGYRLIQTKARPRL